MQRSAIKELDLLRFNRLVIIDKGNDQNVQKAPRYHDVVRRSTPAPDPSITEKFMGIHVHYSRVSLTYVMSQMDKLELEEKVVVCAAESAVSAIFGQLAVLTTAVRSSAASLQLNLSFQTARRGGAAMQARRVCRA